MKHTKKEMYARLVKKLLNEIKQTPKENEERFKLLNKKANRYLRKYEALP